MSQSALRPSTSTSSFLIVSHSSQPTSPVQASPSPLVGRRAPPNLSTAWLNLLPALALLDLTTTLLLCMHIWERDVVPHLVWGIVRSAVVGIVGWGLRTGASGAGPGWISGTTTLTVLLVFWRLNLLFQTHTRHGQQAPPGLAPDASAWATLAMWTSETLKCAVIGPARRGLTAHYMLLSFTTVFALVEETASFMLSTRLPPGEGRRPFAIRRPRQTPTFLPFSIASTRVSSSDDGDGFIEALDLDAEAASESSDDDLSESEIVDLPPSCSSSTSLASAPKNDKLARSLSRSWSRRQMRTDADWAPKDQGTSGARPAEDDGGARYGTFAERR